MFYFILSGILLAFLLKRNPLGIIYQSNFRLPSILIFGFLAQLLISILKTNGVKIPVYLLLLTFIIVLCGLLINRSLVGANWLIVGCLLNIAALLANGGVMPVSLKAAELAGLGHSLNLNSDPRHQLMAMNFKYWWLGDWIPFLRHVLSPGDILVGIGLIRYVVHYSIPRRTTS